MEGEEDPLAAANKKPASTGPAGVGATRIPFRERDIALKSFRARRAARGSLWWAQQVAERASVALRAAIAVEDAARVQWILLPETGPTAEMLDYSERRLALSVEGVQDGVAQLGALEADLADLPTALPVVTQLRILKQALAGQVGELHAALARLRDRAKRAAALSDGSHGGAGSSAGGGGAPEKTVRRRGAKAEAESESGYEAGSESDSLANYSSASCFERMRESSGAGKHDRILWGGNHWAAVDAQGRPVSDEWGDSESEEMAGEFPVEGMEGEKGVRSMHASLSHTHGAHYPYLPPRSVVQQLAASRAARAGLNATKVCHPP
ncbi:hypothetical protein T484DRAFT_1824466 [Baffinella frigidus]|nr:hypothetical protein T484DRAFT_1824466 [Cryptophyta sp. CCMP2293]